MSLSNTYVSTPGTLFNIPADGNQYVYLLSSINQLAGEIIIRNAGTSPFIVSTTQGLTFSPSLSTQTLSSFTATAPYSFISVVPRTPTEYMLLESPNFTPPQRTGRLDLAPNYLYLSTLSTLQLTATNQATLGDFTIGIGPTARIVTYPGAATALIAPSATATYASVGTLYASSIAAVATTADTFTTRGIPIVNASAYYGALSTLTTTTVSNAAAFQGDLTQTDGLGLGPAALYTVAGAATFGSTVKTTTAAFYGPAVAAHSTLTTAGAVTATAAFSTLGIFTTTAEARTDGLLQANHLSTISYNALATAHPVRATFGNSNDTPYTAYVQGTAAFTAPFTTPATSSLTVSTAFGTYSTLTFLDAGTAKQLYGVGTSLTIDGTPIASGTYAPFFSTILASNFVDVKGTYRTSTLQVNGANPTSYSASSPQYTLEARGNMYVSTAFVMDNFAVYGGANPSLYTTPAFNTLYASTNGLLINNRLFVDGIQNRVGVNTTAPAYTLDISGSLYVNAVNVFNTAGANWVVASDAALKQNIQDISASQLTTYSAMIEGLPLKRFRYKQDRTYNVDISRQVIDAEGNPVLDGQGQPLLENATVEQTDVGFATEYGLGSAYRYGFVAQDVELFFPNSVYEIPFYKYPDFHFLTPDQVYNAQYAITRTMISTVVGHSTIVGHRDEFISTVSQRQKDLLTDISNAAGFPYNAITIGTGGRWSFSSPLQPAAPTGFTVVHRDLGFDISWNSTGEANIKYIVYYKNVTAGASSYTPIDRGSATTASITGLTDLNVYEMYVVAKNTTNNLNSTYTPTRETAYSWPKDVAVTVTPGSSSLTLNFRGNKTGGTFVSYKIYNAAGTTLLYEHASESAYTFTGLDYNTSYSYSVSLVTKEGPVTDEVVQESAKFTTIPTSPYAIPLVSATVEGLDGALRFTITGTARGGLITKYRIYNNLGVKQGADSISNVITISSLTNGTSYTYRVTAVSTVGEIDLESAQFSINGTPAGVPIITMGTLNIDTNGNQPYTFRCYGSGISINDNGSPITSITIRFWSRGTSATGNIDRLVNQNRQFTFTRSTFPTSSADAITVSFDQTTDGFWNTTLLNYYSYDFVVRNEKGNSAQSNGLSEGKAYYEPRIMSIGAQYGTANNIPINWGIPSGQKNTSAKAIRISAYYINPNDSSEILLAEQTVPTAQQTSTGSYSGTQITQTSINTTLQNAGLGANYYNVVGRTHNIRGKYEYQYKDITDVWKDYTSIINSSFKYYGPPTITGTTISVHSSVNNIIKITTTITGNGGDSDLTIIVYSNNTDNTAPKLYYPYRTDPNSQNASTPSEFGYNFANAKAMANPYRVTTPPNTLTFYIKDASSVTTATYSLYVINTGGNATFTSASLSV